MNYQNIFHEKSQLIIMKKVMVEGMNLKSISYCYHKIIKK